MSDKLSESIWTSFTKKHDLKLDDGPLIKALAQFDKIDEDKYPARLKALEELADQVKKQIVALAKRKKELGDKPFGLAKDKLDEFFTLSEELEKKTRKAAEAAAAQESEETDSPVLLTTKMVPLLRELRKGEAQMHALIGIAGKATAVLIMRRPISPARRKLLAEAMDASGGGKYHPAECLYEGNVLTFVVKAPSAGMAKRLRAALLEQTELRLKVKVRGDDGEDADGEDGGETQAGAQEPSTVPPVPTAQGPVEVPVEKPGPSPEQLRYEALLGKLKDPVAQALRDQHPEAAKLRVLMGFAMEKADEKKDYVAALQALEKLEPLLAPVATKKVEATKPEGPVLPGAATGTATIKAPNGPIVAGPYSKMKGRILPQLDMAKTRNPLLGEKIKRGVADADALSLGGDDAVAIASLRGLVQEVEDLLALDRQEIQTRMDALYDKATRIRLELKPDPDTLRSSVRGLMKAWDLGTAKVMLDTFEKAIEKAKPLDFEDIGVVEKQRAVAFRKENAKAARNTEQALMAAKRVIDDDGNLLLGDALLDDPAYANPTPGSKEEAQKQRAEMHRLLRDLPFIRVDDLASVAEELGASKEAGLPQSVHALQMLQRLQSDKKAQAALNSVKAPPDPSTGVTDEDKQALRMAQALIRNTLGLADDAVLTDADAKRAAMAALLAEVRQGSVGSCFATASAVRVQRNKPEQFLADMAQMMSTGKLKREIESPVGTKLQIEVPISSEMVGRKVDVKRTDAKLHMRPNMIAGLDALGVEEAKHKETIDAAARRLRAERAVQKALAKIASFLPPTHTVDALTKTILKDLDDNKNKTIEAALTAALAGASLSTVTPAQSNERKKLATDCCKEFDNVNGSDDFTPQELLAQIGKTRPSGPLPPDKMKAAQAAYDTSQDNTLTRAWEYTLASMAEKVPEAATKAKTMANGIGSAAGKACKAIGEKLITDTALTGTDAGNERVVVGEVSAELTKRLQTELKVLYDPEVQSRSGTVSSDGSSSKGGWSLFFRGKKVDGQGEFETVMKTLLDEVKQNFDLNTLGWPPEYVSRAKAVADTMKDTAETATFRDSVVDSLVTTSGLDKDKFNQPWTMARSGWEYSVMQLYENQAVAPPSVKVGSYKYKDESGTEKNVEDAEGLTHFVMDTMSKLVNRLPDGDGARNANVPVANTPHAFSLTPGSTSMQTLLKQGKAPGDVVKELKEVEGAKNAKRRAMGVPLGDLSTGIAAELIDKATALFGSAQGTAIAAVRLHFQALGQESIPMTLFASELKKAVRQVFDTSYAHIGVPQRESYTKSAMDAATGAILERVVPKEEFEPLIDAAMRKLSVPEDSRDTIKKAVLAALKQDAVGRGDLAKAVRAEMRKLGLGGGDEDLKLTAKAYNELKTDPERIAALKAAGQTVTAPPATYEALKEEEQAALREHGVCARLDARLDTSLVEPRGIVFADTNWGDGDHMTHLSMVVNPLSDPPVIEMWTMKEDGSGPAVKDGWIKDSNWRIYADPDTYGGTLGAHEITTADGRTLQWEAYRAELQIKLNDFVTARMGDDGDLGRLRGILDIADARFGEADFAAADLALKKLAEKMAPNEAIAGKLAKGLRPLETVSGEVRKKMDALKADAKEKKLKQPTAEQKEASAAYEVLGSLIYKLRNGVKSTQELSSFVTDNRDVLDYIDTQSPISLNLITALTT